MKNMNLARRDAIKKIGVGAVAGAALSAGNVLQSFGATNVKTDRMTEYSWVRGFNYQPSWGCNGIQIWNDFRESTFVHEVDLGLKLFPKLNVLRIWFSYDAYISNRTSFLAAAKQAAAILSSRNIKMIPVIFNNWHSIVDFGGFSIEQLNMSRGNNNYGAHRQYLRELAEALLPANNLLMYDIANEPFNNGGLAEITLDFLKSMSMELKKIDTKTPVSIGTQGIFGGEDLSAIDPFVDIHAIHPYWCKDWCSQEENVERFAKMINQLKKLGKPVIATECCWGSNDDAIRVKYIRNDLDLLKQAGIGFLPHGLHHSFVADLHRPLSWRKWDTMYMGFIEPNGLIRSGHEIYNEY